MKKLRILLADDHPEMLSAICGVLEDKLGEVVETVADGEALVEAAQRLKPDIIIADISMPKMNGLEATRILHASVPQSKVIILSVHRCLVKRAGEYCFMMPEAPLAQITPLFSG